MREFAFELALCAHLESRTDGVVARQLGGSVHAPANRVLDVVVVEPGPAFDERTAITPHSIPALAIESAVGTGKGRYWRTAIDAHPDVARRVVDRAVEIGFFERERRGGRAYVRQATRYPDWFGEITAIENKPDLGTPGDLERQLRLDVSLGLVDEVILATESYVTGAHLNRIPEAVGVWRFDPDADATERIEVIREPTSLDPTQTGVELVDERPLRTDVALVDPTAKARKRRRLAERAYGKGWRTYAFPACAKATVESAAGASLPHCRWADAVVDAAHCGADCPGFEAASAPDVDLERERADRTPWVADPDGLVRQQSGLDRYT